MSEAMYRVARITTGGPWGAQPARIFFDPPGRGYEWAPGSAEEPGSPQVVPAAVAEAIQRDPGLAPHFLVERLDAEPPTRPARPRRRDEAEGAER
jgi:hypothetical protein